jgi:amidohydrolase
MNPILPDLKERFLAPSPELPWEQDIVALRRDLHEHPELGFEETRTAALVAARLEKLGFEVRTGVGVTGVIGVLRGARPGPTVLVRADMDALPIVEENDWAWKSATSGKMHACGHDAHVSIGLTVARLLAAEKNELAGAVKFMFQPAEEGLGGAGYMLKDGLLDDPRPDFALALHVWSTLEAGTVAVSAGPVMASADGFTARIIGRGGHGAIPEQTVDPIVVAAQVVLALQTVVARNVSPLHPAVVTVGSIEAGSGYNIIPNQASLRGTTRAFDEETRTLLEERCRAIITELPRAFGATGELDYERGYPVVNNDSGVAEMVRRAATTVVGEANVTEFEPTMGAEDMAMVLEQVPGCYFFVGGRNPEVGASYPHHHPKFNIDERALFIGARTMAAAVRECLAAK